MSTGYKNITGKRMAQLGARGEVILHAHDLARVWGIQNKNTLYTTLKRYAKTGLLHRIYKGLYSLLPLEKLDASMLGFKALHRRAYLSLESVLFDEGFISQPPQVMTFVSSVSRKFTIGSHHYSCHRLPDRALFNPVGLDPKWPYYRASSSRALADLLYLSPHAAIEQEWRVDWKEVKKIQETLSYPLTPDRYDDASKT